jgi:hypothetical protein
VACNRPTTPPLLLTPFLPLPSSNFVSLHYDNNHNFEVYGHQKFKVGAIRSFGNVMAYASDFGGKWKAPGTILSTPNAMFDNHVIYDTIQHPTTQQYHSCAPWHAKNNTLYGPHVVLPCGTKGMKKSYTLAEWQALDPKTHDVGSKVVSEIPSGKEIIALARTLLG